VQHEQPPPQQLSFLGEKAVAAQSKARLAPASEARFGWEQHYYKPSQRAQHHHQQHQQQQQQQHLSGFNFNWSDPGWKWLVVTNAATLIVGVYLGNAYARGSCASSSGGCVSTSSREASVPVTPISRVA
jgi:hypothetical protein